MIDLFLSVFSLLSLGRMPSCIKIDTESGSSICLPRWMRRWQAGLIISEALHYKRDYRWQLRLLIKAGTLKKTEEPRSRRTSVSSHQASTLRRRLPFPNTTSTSTPAAPLYSSPSQHPTPGCQSCREREVTSQEFASSLEAHHVSGSLSCVRLPPGKLWSSPRLRTSRLLAEEGRDEGREKINRMFFHLVNWQHRLLERCLSKGSTWKAFRLAEGRIGKWRLGELLSLDEVSELPWFALRGFPASVWSVIGEQVWKSAWLKSCWDYGAPFSWASQNICVGMSVYVCIITLNIQVEKKSCALFLPELLSSLPE